MFVCKVGILVIINILTYPFLNLHTANAVLKKNAYNGKPNMKLCMYTHTDSDFLKEQSCPYVVDS